MTIKAQVVHGLKWQAIMILGQRLLSLVVFTALARLLDPTAFGLVALVGVYLTFVSMIADQGIGTALIQHQHLEPEHLDSVFWFNIGSNTVLCIGTIVLARPISEFLGDANLTPLIRWASLALVIGAASQVHSILFMKSMDFRSISLRVLIANLAGGIVGLGMALAHFGVWSLVGQQLVVAIVGTVFIWTASSFRPSFRFSYRHLREFFGVSASIFASTLLWFFSCRIDQIVIGRYAGVLALGLYVVAGKIPDLITQMTQQPMKEVTFPALSQLQNSHERMRQAVYSGMELNAAVAFATFVGMAAIASDFLPLFFGDKWKSAALVCSLLSIYALINALQDFFYPALMASGGAGNYFLVNVWHVVGVLIACLVGIRYSVTALVIGLIINGIIGAIPATLYLRNRIGLIPWEYYKPCIAPACAALFMTILIWLMAEVFPPGLPSTLRLACKIVVGAIGYAGFLFVFKRNVIMRLIDVACHVLKIRTFQRLEPSDRTI
jgi:O-antigen/teichoic acid export membrane protein